MRCLTCELSDQPGCLDALPRLWALRSLAPLGSLKKLFREAIGNR